jgi:D-alanine-D-alanine ligase
MQHDILTPKFQVMETGREKLDPDLEFPLIVKPNAEGSSKGIGADCVVDTPEALREAVKAVIERYNQPALVEEYIKGREFTVGLLGSGKRPRVLPPMEIKFKDTTNDRPVYDYDVKQEWEKHVEYTCPAELTDAQLKAMEKIARETFWSLDCRDFARIDFRMDDEGKLYVFEVNPLPGLTPGYSDLVLIAKAAGMTYDLLIGEVMSGGLRRLRDKRREERAEEEANGNGRDSEPASKAEIAAAKAEKAAEKAEKAAKRIRKLARKTGSGRRKHSNGAAATESAGNGNGNGATIEVPPTTH